MYETHAFRLRLLLRCWNLIADQVQQDRQLVQAHELGIAFPFGDCVSESCGVSLNCTGLRREPSRSDSCDRDVMEPALPAICEPKKEWDLNGRKIAGVELSRQTLSQPVGLPLPCGHQTINKKPDGGVNVCLGEIIVNISVQLKVCEGCGSLWVRANQAGVYCERCVRKLKDFPAVGSRRQRRQKHKPESSHCCAVVGGAV